MTGVYKCLSNISPPITWDYFKHKISSYNLGNTQLLELSKCRLKTYGLNTALFKGALLWNNLPNFFWKAKSLIYFENKIQEWTGRSCTCCLLYLLLNCLLLKKCRYIKQIKSIVIYIYIYIYLYIYSFCYYCYYYCYYYYYLKKLFV